MDLDEDRVHWRILV